MNKYIELALKEANKSLKYSDVPVGAVIVEDNRVVSKGHNQREKKSNVVKHAEMIALEKACKKKQTWRLDNCVMYITLEPCMMCWSAINQSRIKKVFYALPQTKKEVLDRTIKEHISDNDGSQKLLNEFFLPKRK